MHCRFSKYALTVPAPRRHRTWLHRVSTALDALRSALDTQLHAHQDSIDLLAELASSEPDHAIPIERLRQELLDLSIAVASLREQIEPEPVITVDPGGIRDQRARIAD